MSKIKWFISKYAEYYLIAVVLMTGYSPHSLISPVALVLVALLVLQVIFKNSVTGILIASLFLLVNVYMLFAMISEFNEFPAGSIESLGLLLFGLAIFTVNVTISVLMIMKYGASSDHAVLKY